MAHVNVTPLEEFLIVYFFATFSQNPSFNKRIFVWSKSFLRLGHAKTGTTLMSAIKEECG